MTFQPPREGRLPSVTAAPVPDDTSRLVLLLNPMSVWGWWVQLGSGPPTSGGFALWAHFGPPAWGSKWLVMSFGAQLLFFSLMKCPFCLPGQTQNFPEPEAAPFGSILTLTGGSSELPNCPLFPESDPQAAPCTPFSDPISPLPQLLELSAVLFGSCKLSTSLPRL